MENRRQYVRFPFSEPIGYQRYREGPLEGSVAKDLSISGLKLCVNEFIPLNTVLEVQINLPNQTAVIPARAKVVWVREISYRDDGWEIGLQLMLSESSLSTLREFVGIDQRDSF